MAKLSTLQDNFDDNSLDPVKWGTSLASGGTVQETGQEIVFSVQAATIGSFVEIYSQDFYDAQDESNYVNLVGTAGTKCDTYFHLTNNISDRVGFIWDSGDIASYTLISGVDSYRQYATVAPGTNTYLRIRHSGSTIYWEYSINGGQGWTTLDSVAQPFSLASVQVLIGVYEWGSSPTPGTGRFDNFNSTTESNLPIQPIENIGIVESVSVLRGDANTVPVGGIENIRITDVATVNVEYVLVEICMNTFSTSDNLWFAPDSVFDADVDACLAAGITKIRVEIGSYEYPDATDHSKAAILRAKAKGAHVLWGLSGDNITASNWPNQRATILGAAQWAQDNGVDEFAIGNEEEYKVDGTTITVSQVQANLKALATEVQAIFTRGPVSYHTSKDFLEDWLALGKGDIDTMGWNLYMGGQWGYDDTWMDAIDLMVAEWGDNAFLSEFAPSYTNLADYSTNETTQATGTQTMMDYCSFAGIRRAYWFAYYDDTRPFGPTGFGAKKVGGTYRELWPVLLRFEETVTSSVNDRLTINESIGIQILSQGVISKIDNVYVSENIAVVVGAPFLATVTISTNDSLRITETLSFSGNYLFISVRDTIRTFEYSMTDIVFVPQISRNTPRKTRYSGSIGRDDRWGGATNSNSNNVMRWGGSI